MRGELVNNRKFTIGQSILVAPPLEKGLYLVSTPIGNLRDITIRALETLAASDLIACEDTRTSGVLLARYGIVRPKTSYNEHNANKKGASLLNRLKKGNSISLISDAGTPLVSDPGSRLASLAIEAGIQVIPVPGASAPIAALVASNLPNEKFMFGGFLPPKHGARLRRLAEFDRVNATLIFFESPKRLSASLADMMTVFGGDRRVCIAREITKMHETFYRGTLGELSQQFAGGVPPKGEIVVLIDAAEAKNISQQDIDDQLLELLKIMPVGKAASTLAADIGQSRRTLYQRALAIKDQDGRKQ